MDTGLLDMLHDTADQDLLAIADRINIEFNGILEIRVDMTAVPADLTASCGLEFILSCTIPCPAKDMDGLTSTVTDRSAIAFASLSE
jgi:hypothetical protein